MILQQLNRLEEETSQNIRKEQQRRDSGEISDEEYANRYEAIMDNYRLMTETILKMK